MPKDRDVKNRIKCFYNLVKTKALSLFKKDLLADKKIVEIDFNYNDSNYFKSHKLRRRDIFFPEFCASIHAEELIEEAKYLVKNYYKSYSQFKHNKLSRTEFDIINTRLKMFFELTDNDFNDIILMKFHKNLKDNSTKSDSLTWKNASTLLSKKLIPVFELEQNDLCLHTFDANEIVRHNSENYIVVTCYSGKALLYSPKSKEHTEVPIKDLNFTNPERLILRGII